MNDAEIQAQLETPEHQAHIQSLLKAQVTGTGRREMRQRILPKPRIHSLTHGTKQFQTAKTVKPESMSGRQWKRVRKAIRQIGKI